MTITLADIAMDLGTVKVKVNGKDVTLRRLTAGERRAARAHMPVPVAPRTRKDPTKGSDAELLPDFDDPGFRAAHLEYSYDVQAIEIAIAMGLTLSNGQKWSEGIVGAPAVAFAKQARADLEKSWDAQTFERVYAALNDDAVTPAKDAEGNSSTRPQTPTS